MRRTRLALAALVLVLLAAPVDASAQIGGALRRAAGRVAAGAFDPQKYLEGDPPITTSLSDAVWAVDSLDGFQPDDDADDLDDLERTDDGGFVLEEGFWAMETQSYCLKAGTHGPGGGDGYLFAPPAGPAEVVITTILRESVDHPEVEQHDIQVLLWAIIARAKFEDLEPRLKATALKFLTPEVLARLNRSALDILPDAAMQQLIERAPAPLHSVLRAENELRQMMTSSASSFEQMERVAVLAGMAPRGEGSRDVPSGRWSMHPDGYYVRYLPSGYSQTRVEIWVPEGSPAVGKTFDPALHIAVPGNTARQRLVQSAREHD